MGAGGQGQPPMADVGAEKDERFDIIRQMAGAGLNIFLLVFLRGI